MEWHQVGDGAANRSRAGHRRFGALSWRAELACPFDGLSRSSIGSDLGRHRGLADEQFAHGRRYPGAVDAALLERSTDFVTAARSLRHHAERFGRSADKDERRTRLD